MYVPFHQLQPEKALFPARPCSVAQPVTVSASSTSVNPGDTITITGDNWLPPQQLQVSIIPSQGGASNTTIASTTAAPDGNGHFSINLTINSDAHPVNMALVLSQQMNQHSQIKRMIQLLQLMLQQHQLPLQPRPRQLRLPRQRLPLQAIVEDQMATV